MNPTTNVKIPQFWRLHYLINHRFEEKLQNFRATSEQTIPVVIAALEAAPAVTVI